jgi:hypothetical protein
MNDRIESLLAKHDVASILEEMAELYDERNKTYKDTYKRVGPILAQLFPNGLVLRSADDFAKFHLVVLVLVKLVRFTTSDMNHEDSISDLGVYSAMIAELMRDAMPSAAPEPAVFYPQPAPAAPTAAYPQQAPAAPTAVYPQPAPAAATAPKAPIAPTAAYPKSGDVV